MAMEIRQEQGKVCRLMLKLFWMSTIFITMFMKKPIACICALSHQSGFLQSPLECLVAGSNDCVSVVHSPECWEAVNIPTSLLGPSPSSPPPAPLGSPLQPSSPPSPPSPIPSAFPSRGISFTAYSKLASASTCVPRIPQARPFE